MLSPSDSPSRSPSPTLTGPGPRAEEALATGALETGGDHSLDSRLAVGPGLGAIQQGAASAPSGEAQARKVADVPQHQGGADHGKVEPSLPVEARRAVTVDALTRAIRLRDENGVRELLSTHIANCKSNGREASGLFDEQDEAGRTALETAAAYGRTKIMQILIEHGANPNPSPRLGATTPLGLASEGGHFLCALQLLEEKADINLKSGETGNEASPLVLALQNGKADIAELLMMRRAEVERRA